VAAVRRDDGLQVSIPDLRGAGLTFKRIQRLSFHNQPVVQMVYLPENGEPIALCATVDPGPDETPHARHIGELDAVEWRQDRIGYLLVARDPHVDLTELSQQISNGITTNLYGRRGEVKQGAHSADFPG